jgi:betaine-aldehyde dehydrogenase
MMVFDETNERPMLINGELVHSISGDRLESVNPATEEVIGSVPAASQADVERAVVAAKSAAVPWGQLSIDERAGYLRRIADAIRQRAEEILRAEVIDTGNTIAKTRGDVASAGRALNFYAGLGSEIKGQTVPASPKNIHLTLREPYGVVGRIIPFNHPIKFAANALSAPLMAGNAVILKPPEQSSLSATVLAEICQEILPPGVVNIVTGMGIPVGDTIARHPDIPRVGFTGSLQTGLAIQRAAATSTVKHISLELGGKNPLIAYADNDPAKIAEVAVRGMNFAWQGQSCGSTSRLLLHESLYDAVLEQVVERVRALRLGDPSDDTSQMGPINSKRHYERVLALIASGKAEGARLLLGGARPAGKQFERGYWLQPTVFADVGRDMKIAQEEIFGPVLTLFKWRDEAEALELANSTQYGLTASIWTQDINAALRAVRKVRCGYMWINGVSGHFYGTPFGGLKSSGIGNEEGIEELLSYTVNKTVHLFISGG